MSEPELALAEVRRLVAAEGPAGGTSSEVAQWLRRLCAVAARVLPASGAGVSVMTEDGARGVAAASDSASEKLEELQFTLGEGPCVEAFTTRRPVLQPDLGPGAHSRWPAYSPAAYALGARAVFAFPLQVGAARLGILDVYRHDVGTLTVAELGQALIFAEVAVQTLLDGQERAPSGEAPAGLDEAMSPHYVVYQAQGMVMVDLSVSLADAMARLRAHAYSVDRPVREVAEDIVAGRLRLDPDNP